MTRNLDSAVQRADITLSEIVDTVLFIYMQDDQTKQVWKISIKVIEKQAFNHNQEKLLRSMKTDIIPYRNGNEVKYHKATRSRLKSTIAKRNKWV